jgi:hypothetical protein
MQFEEAKRYGPLHGGGGFKGGKWMVSTASCGGTDACDNRDPTLFIADDGIIYGPLPCFAPDLAFFCTFGSITLIGCVHLHHYKKVGCSA